MKKQSILSFVLALIVLFSSSTLPSFAGNNSADNFSREEESSYSGNQLVGAINPPAVSLDRTSVYIAPEQYLTLTAALIPAAAGSGITWSSSNTSVVTVSSDGTLNGVSPGTATVTASLNIYLGGYTCYAACSVTVTEIPNGTYFIKNKQNSDYVRIKNGTISNNQNAVQYDFDGTNYERWIFALNNTTGYYSIKSAVPASASVYLCVKSDSSALNEQIVIHSGAESTLTDGMKWKISVTSSGAYKLTPKTGENAGGTGVDYVLATGTSNGTNNTNLIQGKYVYNTSYRDEWYIYKIIPEVPTAIQSNSNHSCIPCAITNTVGYWDTHGYPYFSCSSVTQQNQCATEVSLEMDSAAGSSAGHTANNYIPVGFGYFVTTYNNSLIYYFNSVIMWRNTTNFTIQDIKNEIDNGRPLLIGYQSDGPYPRAHMTVCVGYTKKGDDYYLVISDALTLGEYVEHKFDSYNDFITKVSVEVT